MVLEARQLLWVRANRVDAVPTRLATSVEHVTGGRRCSGRADRRHPLLAVCEDDVAFGVCRRGAIGDVAHRAPSIAANGDRLGAALARNEQIAGSDTGVDEACPREAKDAVGARVRVPWYAPVGEEGRPPATEIGRHEARTLDADVLAVGKAGPSDGTGHSSGTDRVHAPGQLVGRDQVAPVSAERARRYLDAAFEPRSLPRDGRHATRAIDGEEHGSALEGR